MIDVKIDKGVAAMMFAGSGLEITAEICMIVHELYTHLYATPVRRWRIAARESCWIFWRERILLCGMRIWLRV